MKHKYKVGQTFKLMRVNFSESVPNLSGTIMTAEDFFVDGTPSYRIRWESLSKVTDKPRRWENKWVESSLMKRAVFSNVVELDEELFEI